MRNGWILILCASLAAVSGPSASHGQEKTATSTPMPASDSTGPARVPIGTVDPIEYRIGPEDVLQISVWKDSNVSRTVTVRPDGKITLPLLNDVEAAGFTPMEFRELLVKKLTEYMPDPEIAVIVVEPHSFKVSLLGEVGKPGRYELRSRTTVLDLIAMAGGLTNFASRSRIVVLRPTGTGTTRLSFDYGKATKSGQENFYLQPGDIVVVP